MSDDDGYTPTTDDVRKAGAYFDHDYTPQGFDRWLAAHDAEVRADERARIAAEKAKWQAEALRVAADALSGLPAEDWRRAYPDQHLEAVADAIDPEVRAVERERRGDEP